MSFTDIEAEAGENTGGAFNAMTGDTSPATALAAPSTSPAELGAPLDLSETGIEGEVRRTDVNIPKLTLVNALSKSRTEGELPLGAFVFADEVVLVAPKKGSDGKPEKFTKPIECFVLKLIKGYQQYVAYGSDLKPARASTIAEVRGLGGTIDRRDKTKVFFEETAQLLVLVPAPEPLGETQAAYFRFEFEGKRYAKAMFFVKSIAYTNVAKPIITRVNNTAEPIINTTFNLHTEFVDGEKHQWWTPKSKVGRLTTPAERAWAASKLL